MATLDVRLLGADTQVPPVVNELAAIFRELPDEELLSRLKGSRRRGRPGYEPVILWRCSVAYYYLGLESVSALIRLLHDNPFVAHACGIHSAEEIPSQPTFSRFGSRLAKRKTSLSVKNFLRALTRRLYETIPGFGKSVAIDSTDVKGWSNGNKKGKKRRGQVRRQKPRVGKVSDGDAGWCVKTNTEGNKKFVWGYKIHILCDTKTELPIVVDTSAGNVRLQEGDPAPPAGTLYIRSIQSGLRDLRQRILQRLHPQVDQAAVPFGACD